MTVPGDLTGEEELGRRVYSSRSAQRASRSRVPFREFLEKPGVTDLSVDRLRAAPPNKVAAIADRDGVARDAVFYGWAVLTVAQAARDGRTAIAFPLPNNPYHADIRLPTLAGEDREEQKRHAQELADVSGWRGRPDRGTGS